MTTERKPLEELSDRELNNIIAQKCIGGEIPHKTEDYNDGVGTVRCTKCGKFLISYEAADWPSCSVPSRYSTDFNAAFEVVEKMKELSVKVVISIETDGDNSVQCGDIIINEPLWTIPKMICVAALMWKDADAELNKLKTEGSER